MNHAMLPTLLINLDDDKARLDAISVELLDFPNIDLQRIPAVYGRYLPDAACLHLSGSVNWIARKGEIGCFLSHVAVWEAISKLEAEWCLVIEDDVALRSLDRILTMGGLDDYEFVFVNDRMSPGNRTLSVSKDVHCLPIESAINVLNNTGKGVGSDGYLIRPNTARSLLKVSTEDKYFGNIDWRLLRYSVSQSSLAPFRGSRVFDIVNTHHNTSIPPAWGVMKAACASSPFVNYKLGIKSRIVGEIS